MGSEGASLGLKEKVEQILGWNVVVPDNGDRVEI